MKTTSDRTGRQPGGRRGARGAALIVAIAIMTILLAIALTFFSVSRLEFDTSTNVINSVRTDLGVDGAIEIAVAHLNEDFLRNPDATSTDHSWRTRFNGAWAAGKRFAMRNGITNPAASAPMYALGVPELDMYPLERALGSALGVQDFALYAVFADGRRERLFRGPVTRGWLYIPRLQKDTILLYDTAVRLVYLRPNGNRLDPEPVLDPSQGIDLVNPALASAGLPTRIAYFTGDPGNARDPQTYPFVTSDVFDVVIDPATLGPAFPVPATSPEQYPTEQVDAWADVDLDGDGLRDAAWFPLQADLFFPGDGLDNDFDGLVDESQENQVDEDGDGTADYASAGQASLPDSLRNLPQGTNPVFDEDEALEAAPFVYWGMGPDGTGDGLDNDRDGIVDNETNGPNGNQLFLTSPLPGLRVQVDMNNDGVLDDNDTVNDGFGNCVPVIVTFPSTIRVFVNGNPIDLDADDVDRIDNDYDQEIGDIDAYAYVGPVDADFVACATGEGVSYEVSGAYTAWRPFGNWDAADRGNGLYANAEERGFQEVDVDAYVRQGARIDVTPVAAATDFLQRPNALRMTVAGEPVCELTGRAAVYIADEAAKLNVNTAHALTYRDQPVPDAPLREGILQRALDAGRGPQEVDLRVLPGIGVATANRIAAARYGAPGGLGLPTSLDQGLFLGDAADGLENLRLGNYFYDVSLPGLGRVDDNADALLLALNGLNDNGDGYGFGGRGIADEGLFLPSLSDLAFTAITADPGSQFAFDSLGAALQQSVIDELIATDYAAYFTRLGVLEGIDEPAEFRRYRATRNPIAERDEEAPGVPLDNDGGGVAGEPGELGDAPYQTLDQLRERVDGIGDTIFGRIRNLVSVHSTDRNVELVETSAGLRAQNRLDFNFAPAQQIAAQLIANEPRQPITDAPAGDGSELVGTIAPADPNQHNTNAFAEGLRRADTGLRAPDLGPADAGGILRVRNGGALEPTTDPAADHAFPADPVLQAMLAAASLVDARDNDAVRTVLRTENTDLAPPSDADPREATTRRSDSDGLVYSGAWPARLDDLNPRERVPAGQLLPLEEIEDYLRTPLGFGSDRTRIGFYGPNDANITDNSGLGAPRLQSLDAWWANFVRSEAQDDTGNPVQDSPGNFAGEQRAISYAVAGAESIRINELMVRPVRRVEAEAITRFAPNDGTLDLLPVDDPMNAIEDAAVTTPNLALIDYFNPSPYMQFDGATGALLPNSPIFDVQRRSVVTATFPDPQYVAVGDYDRDPTTVPATLALGDTMALAPDEFDFEEAPGLFLPNIIEYSFASPDVTPAGQPLDPLAIGLPEGRYYLTMNMADEFGQLTADPDAPIGGPIDPYLALSPFMDAGSPMAISSSVFYSIKYVNAASPNPGDTTSILDDAQTLYDDAVLNGSAPGSTAIPDYRAFMQRVFKSAPAEHFAGGADGSRRGERPGWVWLDGTPTDVRNAIGLAGTAPAEGPYFVEFRGRDDFANALNQPLNAPGPGPLPLFLSGAETHTVYVPPASSGWRLHVAVCFAQPNAASLAPAPEPRINFFDFSQEPDHEWVELANVSDQAIDLGGWQLEIGVPEVAALDFADPFRSRWTVPAGTRIAPGGTLLLGFGAIDYFDRGTRPTRFPAYGGLFEFNGMGLAAGFDPGDVGAPFLGDVTVPPIASNPPDPAGLPHQSGDYARVLTDAAAVTGGAALANRPSYLEAFFDPTFSVFDRRDDPLTPNKDEYRDYVDRDGDGVTSDYVQQTNNPGAQLAALDTDDAALENDFVSTRQPGGDLDGSKPWDRIVYLENEQIGTEPDTSNPLIPPYALHTPYAMSEVDREDLVARVVLRGGVLPNYPEHDGIDNDGDGGTLRARSIPSPIVGQPAEMWYFYVPGELDNDMVDNDLDGFADVMQAPYDRDNSDTTAQGAGFEMPDMFLSEGVDEGGNDVPRDPDDPNFSNLPPSLEEQGIARRYGPGSFEPVPLPVRFLADRYRHTAFLRGLRDPFYATPYPALDPITPRIDDLTDFMRLIESPNPDFLDPLAHPALTFDLRTGGAADVAGWAAFFGDPAEVPGLTAPDSFYAAYRPGTPQSPDAPYLGSREDPPDWTAFVERRWNPGDCVIVSLYVGDASEGQVADRATYREYDVINRAIDDTVPAPYVAVDNTPLGSPPYTPRGFAALNADYPSFWLPDQMGLDFYRSLERKDALFAGDRFGTRNRWEATDGNYDDWAESLSFWAPVVGVADEASSWNVAFASDPLDVDTWRFRQIPAVAGPADVDYGVRRRLFGHALYGSPLRMNTAQRIARNPADLVALLDDATAANRADDPIAGRLEAQFLAAETLRVGQLDERPNADWQFRAAAVPNRPYTNPADAMRAPLVLIDHIMANTARIPGISETFLWDDTPINYQADPGGGRPQNVLLSRRAAIAAGVPAGDTVDAGLAEAIADTVSTDTLVLTVGQAAFTPIQPNAFDLGINIVNLVNWTDDPAGSDRLLPPAAWAPVFLNEFTVDGLPQLDPNRFPNYPSYPDGRNAGVPIVPFYLLDSNFLFARALPAPFRDAFGLEALAGFYGGAVAEPDLGARWPLERRAVAYVSAFPSIEKGVDPTGREDEFKPEALFTWDAADGVENGEYILYIGTYLPGLNEQLGPVQQQITAVRDFNAGGVAFAGYGPGLSLVSDAALSSFLPLDPTGVLDYASIPPAPLPAARPRFQPSLVVEAITEPTLARGYTQGGIGNQTEPGLPRPDQWYAAGGALDAFTVTPGPDGYVLYGNNATSVWRAQRVRIDRNFLALRIRNNSTDPNEVAILTHVVLAPRKRTPGRVNINTVENRLAVAGVQSGTPREELFNAALGLPGVLDVLTTQRDASGNILGVPINDGDDVDPGTFADVTNEKAWPAPTVFTEPASDGRPFNFPPEVYTALPTSPNTPRDLLADPAAALPDANVPAALRLTGLMMAGRTKHPDGRYYRSLNDLVSEDARFPHPNPRLVVSPGAGFDEVLKLSPLSNGRNAAERFEESYNRLRRMANSITLRSDVFEIQAIVQSGYVLDLDGDAQFNYRSNDEFVTTGEKRARVVYERRVPADRSDSPDAGGN